MNLLPQGYVRSTDVQNALSFFPTPFYLYDEQLLRNTIKQLAQFIKNHLIQVRYAMKANSNKAILQIADQEGLHFDASSLEEVQRAVLAGIHPSRILLTSQQTPTQSALVKLKFFMNQGLIFNACSLGQLRQISLVAKDKQHPLFCRIHPGLGSGESPTRDTGSFYSCFGIHSEDIPTAVELIHKNNLYVKGVHLHIGSGGEPEIWKDTVLKGLDLIKNYFQQAVILNLGGGFKIARMPGETTANLKELISYACQKITLFSKISKRDIHLEIEPGAFIIANAGYLVTTVIELKSTGSKGFRFVLLNAGMDANPRPLLYGSQHPFYIIRERGILIYSDYHKYKSTFHPLAVVGKCCETGDSQTLDQLGRVVPRTMISPEAGDTFVIGGCGAYCSAMAMSGYNTSLEIPEILLRKNRSLLCIRKPQSLKQLIENEISLPEFKPEPKNKDELWLKDELYKNIYEQVS